MAAPQAERRIRSEMLILVRAIPQGAVATVDLIAARLGVIPTLVSTLLANLTEDEREAAPWYRVVAKGGAIGRGPHRDAQFAKLVREGMQVSPAGIVQDMGCVAVTNFDPPSPKSAKGPDTTPPQAPLSRSRGMKDRPA
jgi:methylated-DNA-protein-cysteine methyltransferase-like protein